MGKTHTVKQEFVDRTLLGIAALLRILLPSEGYQRRAVLGLGEG
jgi:hypothetical protein